MPKEMAIRVLKKKNIYLTSEGRKWLEAIVGGTKAVTSIVQTNS